MMIKIFTTGKDGKITLTAKELKELLDEAYWEGYRNSNHTWTYTTPSWSPYCYTTYGDGCTISTSEAAKSSNTITIDANSITSGSVTLNKNDANNITYATNNITTATNWK